MSARGSPAGEGGAISQLAKSLNLNDGIGEVGSWAAIMQDEQMNAPLIIEEEPETQQTILEGEDTTDSYRRRRPALLFESPYVVHVKNLPERTHEEDLFFHFGGETSVLDVWIRHRDADVELLSDDSMTKALQLNQSPFFGRILEVVICDDYTPRRPSYRRDSQSSHFSTDSRRHDRYSGRDSGGRYGGEHQGGSYRDRDREMMPPPTGYPSKRGGGGGYYGKERGGGYNEQYGGGNRGGRSYDNYQSGGYTNNNHPASYRGGGGNRGHQGHPRGGQGSHPDSSRDGYQNQNKYNSFDDRDRPGSIRRSGSHQFEQRYDRPGSVARSHTDERDRRSVDAPPAPVQPPVKKPTSRDIFGDAKPVDTRQKELEIEEKLRKEKELLKQQAEAERLARNEAAQAAAMAAETHSHPPSKMHSPHYDRSTHSHAPPVHYERKTSSPFDGSPGSVTIIKRTSITKDDDASPPLDPVHPTPVMPEKKSIQQTNEQIVKPSDEQKGDGNKVIRTFTRSSGPVPSVPNPLQKSQTVASIGVDGSGQRGGGSAGRGRGSVRGRGGSSRGGVSHPIGERRGSNDGTHKTKQGGIQKQYPERKDSLTSVRGGASERGGRGGKRSVGERTQSQQDVHSGGKTHKDEERKFSVGGHTKADDGVSSHHREDRLKKSASEDRPAPPKDDSKTGLSAEKRNSVGGGDEKKKGKGGEVGSRKKEKEEKKKLQAMPKLQTGNVTSVLSQNKFALLMDE